MAETAFGNWIDVLLKISWKDRRQAGCLMPQERVRIGRLMDAAVRNEAWPRFASVRRCCAESLDAGCARPRPESGRGRWTAESFGLCRRESLPTVGRSPPREIGGDTHSGAVKRHVRHRVVCGAFQR